MSDDQKDVLIAAYLFEDLAKKDFEFGKILRQLEVLGHLFQLK